jgi:FKBP-type peptidyl-prolyl cis-trans isomerase
MFVAGAIVFLAITGLIEWSNRPAPIEEFGKVGQEYYPDFTDPTRATSLEVYVFDTDTVRPLDFRVQRLDNGRWVIPSHHNYPADAEDQLAKTASSIIGISRGAMITRWEADHAQYGVVNPKQDTLSVGDVEGVGKRIILRGEDDAVLADYIIGNKIDDESDQFYVRHPEEDEVYIAKLDIDLSTKFTDWIDTDLLDADSWDMIELTVNDYSFDETQGPIRLVQSELSRFHRETSSDDWQLDGLNEEMEEVDKDAMRETINTIADLEIAGVRPKQEGLTPDLKLDRETLKTQRDVDRLQSDLLTRGFLLQPGENGDQENLRLIAREGEMYAATDEGLVYRLHFGRAFAGSQEELETGFSSSDDEEKGQGKGDEASEKETKEGGSENESEPSESSGTDPQDADNADEKGGDSDAIDSSDSKDADAEDESGADADADSGGDSGDGDDKKTDSKKPGRYVFVRVEFDKKYLGDEPAMPVPPEKPDELTEADAPKEADAKNEEESAEETKTDAGADGDADIGSGAEGDAGSDGETGPGEESDSSDEQSEEEDKEEEDPLAEIRKEYEEAMKKYEDDLEEYEREKKDFDEKVEEGRKKAEELNRRFADWYYVIPGESFDKLKLSRADLVKPKEKEDEDNDDSDQDGQDPETTPNADAAAANQKAADEFFAENESKEGVVTTDSGLQYEVITEGEGESPESTSKVKVKYKGTLLDGTVFDKSGDDPAAFQVDGVIKGWTEALQLMKSGAKWKLYIPPDLAYGEAGSGDKIGPNCALIFEVELVSVE